jgi:hypothetical protein
MAYREFVDRFAPTLGGRYLITVLALVDRLAASTVGSSSQICLGGVGAP